MHFDDARSASYCRQLGSIAKCLQNGTALIREMHSGAILCLCNKIKSAEFKLHPAAADNNEHDNVLIDKQ